MSDTPTDRPSIICPECKGSGVDDSDKPVIFVIEMDRDGTRADTPCAICFGHGRVWVRDESSTGG